MRCYFSTAGLAPSETLARAGDVYGTDVSNKFSLIRYGSNNKIKTNDVGSGIYCIKITDVNNFSTSIKIILIN
ncbi:MAG: hypothetical protein ABI723_16685 [Bacteroidia bacterium]